MKSDRKNIFRAISEQEVVCLVIIFAVLLLGIALAIYNYAGYRTLIEEDGVVEWLTAFSLLGCSAICFLRVFKLKGKRSRKFILILFLLGLFFLFGMGEEISWGQRIFNIDSSDFFLEHNTQEEVNFHNLKIMGVRLNKAVFSLLLGVVICVYTFLIPVLYCKFEKVKHFMNTHAIPIPKTYQIVFYLVFMIIVNLMNLPEQWELLEFVGSAMFLLIFTFPINASIFAVTTKKKIK